jgi:hypothetical protein
MALPQSKARRLRTLLLEIVMLRAPAEVTLTEVYYEIEVRWELTFLTLKDRECWKRNGVVGSDTDVHANAKAAGFNFLRIKPLTEES